MAKLILLKNTSMHSSKEPEFSVEEFQDVKLEPFTHLVQSLRGFTCNASMLVFGYHFYLSSEYHVFRNAKNLNHIEYASAYYKFHAFQGDILLRLRKACEPNQKSLAAGAISKLLENADNIKQLKNYVKKGRELYNTPQKSDQHIRCRLWYNSVGKWTRKESELWHNIGILARTSRPE